MSIKFQGINASKIEVKLARLADIDNLCRQFAKLSVSNIKQGSVLLLVHPISPDIWRKSSEEEKQKLLEEFIYQLIYQSDVKNLIQKEIDVSIEVNEIKNVFGDPAWRVKKSSQLTKEQQKLDDNWTYLVEEMEVKKIMEYFIERDVMTVMERQKIMDLPGRRERANIFLSVLKHKLGKVSIEDLIDGLVTTGQTYIGDRLKKDILCIDCLREIYKDPQNYEMILDEMVSSTMLQTVAKFEDKMIPHHILNILTPECGKSRRDRAHLFMQYVLLNDEVLRSFENVLATTNHVVFKVKKKCDDCKPRSSKDASYFETSLVEEKDRVFCSFTVRMETDKSLRIISLKRKREFIEKKYMKIDRPLYSRLPSEPYMRELQDPTPIIAAIDFGTTYSGFAFSQKKKHAKIITKQWHSSSGSNLQSFKTPTSILLQPDGKFHSFGYEAEEKYDVLSNGGDHRSWYFCRHFKMELHSSEILKRDTMIEDVLGKKKTAFDIFSMSIKYLKQEAEKLMLEKGQKVVKENISWIITVPAIWTDAAKQFMRQAAEEASIPSDRLTLALEPEVASIYIGALNVEKSRDASSSDVTLVKSAPGARFMVVDIGGGTVDITVMETATEQRFKQISLASGGPCGGKYVNDNILKYLASLVGEDVMETYRVKNMNDYHVLSNEIEFKKRSWKRGSKLQLDLPVSLVDHFEDTADLTFSDHLKTASQKKVNLRGKHKLRIPEDIAEQFTLSVVSDIISHVRDTLGNVKDISYMVIVGGFADNSLLKQEFKSAFPKNNIIIPDEAGLAVLKGAVLFGRDPSCVITRKCDRTYGTLVYRTFLKDDLREKRVKEIDGDYCKDAFNKLVGIGESISVNEKRSTEMQPIRDGMSKMSIKLYGSTEPNPRYVTDRSCTYLGKIVVDIPHQWRNRDEKVIVSMTFGQTEVVVEGKSEHGEHVVTTKLDFLV
ncbi:Hypothetical predicted protein [Mytilus galloprovincialis]|uniref:CARD domain-containing protein n=1 Tax=Mytilus galloprovincialis TaxID=29158 RepID=A0A8B6DYR1_MYTGA|nr:Hypothetical predicted protein [Mytilus galloprovincialis]